MAVEKWRSQKFKCNTMGGPNCEHEHLELTMGAQQLQSDDSASRIV